MAVWSTEWEEEMQIEWVLWFWSNTGKCLQIDSGMTIERKFFISPPSHPKRMSHTQQTHNDHIFNDAFEVLGFFLYVCK